MAANEVVLAVHDVPGFEVSHVTLTGSLHILCGVNASGKTRLLGELMNHVETGDSSKVSLDGAALGPKVSYIDTFWLLQRQRISIASDGELDDRIESAGLTPLKAEDRRISSFLLERLYDSIEIAELDATDDGQALLATAPAGSLPWRALQFSEDVIPFFRVTRGGRTFDSRELSQGELAGLTLIWCLSRLDRDTSLFMDEPETYLSPTSSRNCLDVIAHYVGKAEVAAFVSSHSYLGLASAPQGRLLLLNPVRPGEVEVQAASGATLWRALKLSPPIRTVFVVEDEAARQWLARLLRAADFPDLDYCDIWVGGDATAVRNAARFPSGARGATQAFWGVLDGDERSVQVRGAQGNLFFFPGHESVEALILRIVADSASVFGATRASVEIALAQCEGMEIHERILFLSEQFGFERAAFRDRLLDHWIATEEGLEAFADFAAEVSRAVAT